MPLNESSIRVKAIKEVDSNGNDRLGVSFRASLLDETNVDWYYLRFSIAIDGIEEDDAFIQLADTYNPERYVNYRSGAYSGKAFFDEIDSIPSSKMQVEIYLDDVAYKQKSWYNISKGQAQGSDPEELIRLGINKEDINKKLSTSIKDLGYNSSKTLHKIDLPSYYRNKNVDKITNFNPSTDTIEIDIDNFGIKGSATFATAASKKAIKKKLAKQDFDFLYDEKKGGLYFNENGADKGFGDGGIIAILKGAPDLTAKNLEFA
jgi:hypothetical protein